MDKEDKMMIAAIVTIFVLLTIGQIISCIMESESFNRMTGSNTTWLDAMWLELRVTSDSK